MLRTVRYHRRFPPGRVAATALSPPWGLVHSLRCRLVVAPNRAHSSALPLRPTPRTTMPTMPMKRTKALAPSLRVREPTPPEHEGLPCRGAAVLKRQLWAAKSRGKRNFSFEIVQLTLNADILCAGREPRPRALIHLVSHRHRGPREKSRHSDTRARNPKKTGGEQLSKSVLCGRWITGR
jgi:hypothetical protein